MPAQQELDTSITNTGACNPEATESAAQHEAFGPLSWTPEPQRECPSLRRHDLPECPQRVDVRPVGFGAPKRRRSRYRRRFQAGRVPLSDQ